MKSQKIILLTLLKNLLMEGKVAMSLLDIKTTFSGMNAALQENLFQHHFETDWQDVEAMLARNFKTQGTLFLPSKEVLQKVATVRDHLDGFELFAFKELVKNKLSDSKTVKSINRKIVEQIKDPLLLEELSYWRKISIHIDSKEYNHLFGGKKSLSHRYDVVKDV